MQPSRAPNLVYADDQGRILDHPGWGMAMADGRGVLRPPVGDLVPLPEGSDLFLLPGRGPLGFARGRRGPAGPLGRGTAVAAFMAPAWLRYALPAFETGPEAPLLPLYAYSAVGWADDRFWVPAERIDPDIRQDLGGFDLDEVERSARARVSAAPGDDLLAHLADCALERKCPAARNFFLGRWEAPLPSSSGCNSACVGCISEQPDDRTPTFGRIPFHPSAEALASLAIPHLDAAEGAIVSFGQGCEGEPRLVADTLAESIRLMREATPRGTINMNTNGSRPAGVETLCRAGLGAIRVSINSARKATYDAYYLPRGYAFEEVLESLRVVKRHGGHTSVNWLAFPGVSDRVHEIEAIVAMARNVELDLIQVRNLNIDPALYLDCLGEGWAEGAGEARGMAEMMRVLRRELPDVSFGYFNPPV